MFPGKLQRSNFFSRKANTNRYLVFLLFALASGPLLPSTQVFAQQKSDPLQDGFVSPPETARPRVWWHWMNGNVTKEGIKLDLEWMQRVGIGGIQTFDANVATPVVVPKRLAYMTPEWKDAFRYATDLATQMHFELGIAGSPGFSETGGPWVPAKEAMKKYVWSETAVEGGKPFHGVLTHPPTTTGEFQNLGTAPSVGAFFKVPEFYADTAVIAFRNPETETAIKPEITASSPIDTAILSDGDLGTSTSLALPEKAGEKAWIQYYFSQPQTIRSLTIVWGKKTILDTVYGSGAESGIALEASDDGSTYRPIAVVPAAKGAEHTLSFKPVKGSYFRVTFKVLPPAPNPLGGAPMKQPGTVPIAEVVLHSGARVNHFEEKAAFRIVPDLYPFTTPDFARESTVRKADVIDLTDKMHPDGSLDWESPAGNWTVLRIGYSLLGTTNHPASAEGTGLEVDKLNGHYVKNYMDHYLDSYVNTVGSGLMGKRGIGVVVTDSWEAGPQNWTDDMIAEFTRRRGYDPRPWMPVLTGRIVESSQASDRFLWDFRKTIADLVADEHYGQVEASIKSRGLIHYGESHESDRAMIADGMEVKKLDDVPMSAMWAQTPGVNKRLYNYDADDRESASVAHIYGQNIAAAESLTNCDAKTAWSYSPATLKPTIDQEFLNGINRVVIHESAHQALIGKVPGISMGPCGQWFNRNDTWAEEAGPWINYIARSSWMLQQGKNVADVAYFYGEDSNVTAIFNDSAPAVPAGYSYDYINADGLIHALSVTGDRLTTSSGASYRLLFLDPYSRHMSLPVLRAIHALILKGAVVAGEKPVGTPSLADDQAEFNSLADALFPRMKGVAQVGKGKVLAGYSVAEALTDLRIERDFEFKMPPVDQSVQFAHRRLADGEIYYVDNRGDHEISGTAIFRTWGRVPEIWQPDNGKITPASFSITDHQMAVPLKIEPWGTLFIVFRKPAKSQSYEAPKSLETHLTTLEGGWDVSFQAGRGAPATARFDSLTSWSENADKGIKYFSGTGTYTKHIEAPSAWFRKQAAIWIDLGEVHNLAIVSVNGVDLGTLWHAPYKVDISSALRPGDNILSVRVINPWVNRLIGDVQPDVDVKYTFTTWRNYSKNSPLVPSGLLGPVTLSEVVPEKASPSDLHKAVR